MALLSLCKQELLLGATSALLRKSFFFPPFLLILRQTHKADSRDPVGKVERWARRKPVIQPLIGILGRVQTGLKILCFQVQLENVNEIYFGFQI